MSNNTTVVNLKIAFNRGDAIPGMRAIAAESTSLSQKSSRAQVQANNETARSYDRMHTDVIAGIRRTAQARETLGVRAEHVIQAEIRQTQNAYRELVRSGEANSRELARAQEAMLRKVKELNAEMRTSSTLQSKMQTVVTAGAAIGAGAYVVSRYANQAMTYDQRLALMANTAFADRDVAGRRAGIDELDKEIKNSVRSGVGGGTREQAAEALDAMIARGVLGIERSKAFLPTIMRTASGSGAQPLEIANLSSVLVGQNIVKDNDQLKMALNMITAAGQAGGFEIKDMARWLSQQLPLAQKSGMMGLDGLQKLLTMNQAAILTAGTTDEAGNNVKNLLAKLNSNDTAKDFEKQGRGDLSKFLMQSRLKGVDAVDAWMGVLDKESANNPAMKQMLAKLKTSSDKGEQKQLIDSIAAISEGSVIGKFFQDMQAMSALLAMRNHSVVDPVNAKIGANRTINGVNDVNYALMQSMPSVQLEAAKQAKEAATKEAMDGLTPVIGKVAGEFEKLAEKNPLLTGSTVIATGAITAMATAAGLASFALRTKAGGLPGEIGGGAVGGAVSTGSRTLFAGVGGAVAANLSAIPTMAAGSLLHNLPVIGAMAGINETLFGGPSGGFGNVISQYMTQNNQPTETAKVDTTIQIGLADGLKVINQNTQSSGNVNSIIETGSLWSYE